MGNGSHDYGLQEFVSDLRVITRQNDDEKVVMEKVRPLAKKVAMGKKWVKSAMTASHRCSGHFLWWLSSSPIISSWSNNSHPSAHGLGEARPSSMRSSIFMCTICLGL